MWGQEEDCPEPDKWLNMQKYNILGVNFDLELLIFPFGILPKSLMIYL